MLGYSSNIPKLYAIRMLFSMHFFGAVLVPFYTDWGGLSLPDVLLLNAWFFLCNFALEVPTGTVADFLGRKVSLALGSAVAIAGVLIYISRPRFWVFALAEIVMAAAYTLHSGADEALAYDSLRADNASERAGQVLGRMEAFKLTGILVGTMAGGPIAARLGLRAPMAVYMVPAALAAVVALTLREPPAVGAPVEVERRSYLRLLRDGAVYFRGHRAIRALALEAAITHAIAWSIVWFFQPLLARASVSVAWFGVVHAAGLGAQVALLGNVDWLTRLAGSRRRFLLGASFFAGLAFLLLGVTRYWPLVVIGIVTAMALSLPRIALFNAAVNHHVTTSSRATVLSFCSMLRTAAIVIVNPIVGFIAGRSLSAAVITIGVLLLVSVVLSRLSDELLDP